MLYHDKYEIEPKYLMGDGETIKWNVTGSGESAIGVYEGRRYFLKRNNTILFPDKAKLAKLFPNEEMLKKAIEKKEAPFMELRKKQNKMMDLMKGIDFDRDHIAREIENFRDAENHFVTVTPIVPNGVSREDFDYTSISKDEFLNLAKQMAKEIEIIHRAGVIHSDIKMDNYVISNKKTPYLIDFDISFPAAAVPGNGEVGGTEGHISPEVLSYRHEKTDALAKNVTPKIDIFSFAVTLHYLWTGELPPADDGKSVGEVLLEGKSYRLNNKFNFDIPGKSVKFADLLKAMLDLNPGNRPDASTVCQILEGKIGLGETKKEEPDPVPEPEEKKPEPKVEPKKPEPKKEPEKEHVPLPPVVEIDEPWPSDRIILVDIPTMKSKGFTRIRRGIREGGYILTYASGLVMAHSKNSLLSLGLASKSGEPLHDDRLWPEDVEAGYEIDESVVRRMAIQKIEKATGADGSHNYKLVYIGRIQIVSAKLFALMGLMKK